MTEQSAAFVRGWTSSWRWWFGKPDGTLVRLRCAALGHNWQACDPECCNRWYCLWCLCFGPTLDVTPEPKWRSHG